MIRLRAVLGLVVVASLLHGLPLASPAFSHRSLSYGELDAVNGGQVSPTNCFDYNPLYCSWHGLEVMECENFPCEQSQGSWKCPDGKEQIHRWIDHYMSCDFDPDGVYEASVIYPDSVFTCNITRVCSSSCVPLSDGNYYCENSEVDWVVSEAAVLVDCINVDQSCPALPPP
jgi:hypothetical protein